MPPQHIVYFLFISYWFALTFVRHCLSFICYYAAALIFHITFVFIVFQHCWWAMPMTPSDAMFAAKERPKMFMRTSRHDMSWQPTMSRARYDAKIRKRCRADNMPKHAKNRLMPMAPSTLLFIGRPPPMPMRWNMPPCDIASASLLRYQHERHATSSITLVIYDAARWVNMTLYHFTLRYYRHTFV